MDDMKISPSVFGLMFSKPDLAKILLDATSTHRSVGVQDRSGAPTHTSKNLNFSRDGQVYTAHSPVLKVDPSRDRLQHHLVIGNALALDSPADTHAAPIAPALRSERIEAKWQMDDIRADLPMTAINPAPMNFVPPSPASAVGATRRRPRFDASVGDESRVRDGTLSAKTERLTAGVPTLRAVAAISLCVAAVAYLMF